MAALNLALPAEGGGEDATAFHRVVYIPVGHAPRPDTARFASLGVCLPDQAEAQRGRASTVLLTLYSQCPDSVRKTSYSGGAIYPGGAGFFTQVPRQWPGSP